MKIRYFLVFIFIILLLGFSGCRRSLVLESCFQKMSDYWFSLDDSRCIESREVVLLMGPLLNEEGVSFLISKLDSKNKLEVQAAVLCLLVIYESIENDKGKCDSKKMREDILNSSFFEKVKLYTDSGDTLFIRNVLKKFMQDRFNHDSNIKISAHRI